MKKVSYYLLISFLVITGCDFRLPQDWETPSWHLPLSVPLFNDSITIGEMINTGYTCSGIDEIDSEYIFETLAGCDSACTTQLDIEHGCESIFSLEPNTDNDSYHISIDTTMIEEDSISISDEYFEALPEGLEFSIDVGMDPIQIDIPNNTSIDESETLLLSEFIDQEISFDCIPDSIYSEFTTYTLDPISIGVYDEINVSEIQYLDFINSITIDSGSVILNINNGLPFLIENFELDFRDENNESWINASLSNIDYNENGSNTLVLEEEIVPAEINVVPIVTLSQPTNLDPCIVYLPLSDVEDEIESLWEDTEGCILLQDQSIIDDSCSCISNPQDCNLDIDNDNECQNLGVLYNESNDPHIDLVWDEESLECEIDTGFSGYSFDGNGLNELRIDYSFSIVRAEADVSITLDEEISGSQILEVADGIDLISARLAEAENSDENFFAMNFNNSLFTPIDLSIELDDFYDPEDMTPVVFDIENCDCAAYENENLCSACGSDWEIIPLSNYFIGHPDSEEILDEISYTVRYSIVNPNIIIKMNEPYIFEVSTVELKPLRFESLKVNLERFESPPIEMGDIPVGFEGFELPTLSFDLKFYNEINAPLTLILDLIGISDDADPITIHVEPELAYFGTISSPIDTSILTIDNTELIVQQNLSGDIVSTSYSFGQDSDGEDLSIYDVFAADNVQVEGYAVLSGTSTLEPGKSVWADMEVNIDPLTIIITEDISFISEAPTILEPIDATTSEKIDSGVVSATVDIQFENAIPLDGTFDMIVSNNDKFPPCLDKLRTGIMSDQLDSITTTCYDYINNSFALSSDDSIIVQLRSHDNFYYIEFYKDNDTTFFGKFLNMQLILPEELDNGIVITPSTYTESLDLLGDEVKWLTNDNNLYIVPQVVLSSYDESDPNDDGKRTLLSTNYLQINSLLTFILDMGEMTERQDEQIKINYSNE